jgi:hypothetical protein
MTSTTAHSEKRKERTMYVTQYKRYKGETVIFETTDSMVKHSFDNLRNIGKVYLSTPDGFNDATAEFTKDDISALEFILAELKSKG